MIVEKCLVTEQVPVSAHRIKRFLKSEMSSKKKWHGHGKSNFSHFNSAEIKGEISELKARRQRETGYLLKNTDVVYRNSCHMKRTDTQEMQTNPDLTSVDKLGIG